MSLIINSPISTPISNESALTVMDGTRGLVAKKDGWYDVKSDGSTERIATDTKLSNKVDKVEGKSLVNTTDILNAVQNNSVKFEKGIKFAAPQNIDPDSYNFKIDENGLYLQSGGGVTTIEVGDVILDRGGEIHKLSEKANAADVNNKVDKVEGKSLIDENAANQLSFGAGWLTTLENLEVGSNARIAGFIMSMSGDITADFGNVIANVYSEDEDKVIQHKLSDKVDKVSGKGLSSNDYTDAAKNVVDAITLNSETGTLEISKNIKLTGNGAVTSDYGNVLDTLKVGYLGDNKWAFRMSAASGFSSSVDVTTTLDNVTVHRLSQKANKSDVLTKTNTAKFTPTGDYQPATKKYVDDIVIEAGGGDMLRTVYDQDKTGTVDDSKKLGGQSPSYYAKATDVGVLADLNTTNKTNIVSAVNEKWTGKVYTIEVGDNWETHTITTNGNEELGSYYQEIAVEGITSVGQPFVDVVLSDDDTQAKQQLEDYQCVSRVKTEDGKIILKCLKDRPSSSFTIRVLILGNVL